MRSAYAAAPRAWACAARSSTNMPAPSASTNPLRPRSNGLLAAGRGVHGPPVRVDVPPGFDARVGERIRGGGERKHDEAVDAPRLLRREQRLRVDVRREPGHLEDVGDRMLLRRCAQPGAARAHRVEELADVAAERRDETDSRNGCAVSPWPAHRDASARWRCLSTHLRTLALAVSGVVAVAVGMTWRTVAATRSSSAARTCSARPACW